MPLDDDPQWWRRAVVYQVYPRSFADADGDGTGDVLGIIDVSTTWPTLGVDAVWVSPWFPSPLADGGYDVSDYRGILPEFGTLEQADPFVTRAHELGLRVLIDLVPNHSSDEHPWFQQALAAGRARPSARSTCSGTAAGRTATQPPNNWPAMFGGGAWERTTNADGTAGEWYLHLFDLKQPDWNWDNPAVADEFDDDPALLVRPGVDGFRIDVANSMAKAPGLPDIDARSRDGTAGRQPADRLAVHEPAARARHPAPLADGGRLLRRLRPRGPDLRVRGLGDAGRQSWPSTSGRTSCTRRSTSTR